MANQLFGFSPEAFEQFVRALAISIFGPGTTTFGNGADGGRESTFQGTVPYPYPPATNWSGYGVIQAKCKEKTETAEQDQKWALNQLGEELKTFVRSDKRDPKPEYYVFVTNVELSSAAGGGRDKAEQLVRSYYAQLPLKGHAIWEANQLLAFLGVYENLRRRFRAYVTPGDVLATLIEDIEKRKPNSHRILTAFLQRELRADEASRLDQAGNRTEEQLHLANLFFDLPASPQPQLVPPAEESDHDGRLPHGVLWELLRAGSRKLDPPSVYEQELMSETKADLWLPTRYVLLGGPGSGKSTIGQFLAQVHRSALLARCNPHLLEGQTRRIVRETQDLSVSENLPWPSTPRYPFRIDLNRFSKSLASGDVDRTESLGRYILNSIKGDHDMAYETLLEWLAVYPVLLVLDGLDEVPATSNRHQLVKAVNDFLAEARQAEADLFVVASSREQGYSGEFAGATVAFRHILPLSRSRALRYVQRYVDARFGKNDPRATDVIQKLRDSDKGGLTAQLMSSPLQVTFMATVVAAQGDPGEDRWQLFDSYYRTIYDRERQKAVPGYAAILSKQQATIDRLHHDVGFWLHLQGETSGGTTVSLKMERFELLVNEYLQEQGREGAEKGELSRLITDAARHRLVFLTSRIAGELSFDVTSLQEYMAAECLMTGDLRVVQNRLRAIAPSPYWRNVFLFAASRCFRDAGSRHLQDSIRLLCEDLNSPSDVLFSAIRSGSELAVDVLQSGAVTENPNHARHLARLGLALLSEPEMIRSSKEGISTHRKLGVVFNEGLKSVYREALELHTGQVEVDRTVGAWSLLVDLIKAGVDWAIDLGNSNWPTAPEAQRTILLGLPPEMLGTPWMYEKVLDSIWKLGPTNAVSLLWEVRKGGSQDSLPLEEIFNELVGWPRGVEVPIDIPFQEERAFYLRLRPVTPLRGSFGNAFSTLINRPEGHADWFPYVQAAKFARTPNAQTLAGALKVYAENGWSAPDEMPLSSFPWPIANCLRAARTPEELRLLAHRLETGGLGDIDDWRKSEKRWTSEGISLNDFVRVVSEGRGIIGGSGLLSSPPLTAWSFRHHKCPDSVLLELHSASQKAPSSAGRNALTWFLYSAGMKSGGLSRCIQPSHYMATLETGGYICYDVKVPFPGDPDSVDWWLGFFEALGNSPRLGLFHAVEGEDSQADNEAWLKTFQKVFIRDRTKLDLANLLDRKSNDTRSGLLRLLGRLVSVGLTVDLVPPNMLDVDWFSEPRSQLAAVIVLLSQSTLSDIEAKRLADRVIPLLNPPAELDADRLLFQTVEAHLKRIPVLESFLLRLHEGIPATVRFGRARCLRLLRMTARTRASDLHLVGEPERYNLPTMPPLSSP